MSLDVYLTGKKQSKPCTCYECGNEHVRETAEEFYSSNITHNLNDMAEAAGIYEHLWRPEEIGITKAKDLIAPLQTGLDLLKSDPPRFEKHNAKNGWGLYKHFVPFVEGYLNACKEYPDAEVSFSR